MIGNPFQQGIDDAGYCNALDFKLAEIVIGALAEQGRTRTWLAGQAGMSPASVCRILRGESDWHRSTAVRLLAPLNLRLELRAVKHE